MITPVFYARPRLAAKPLDVASVLAGRSESGSTRKDRLATFAGDVQRLVAADVVATPDPLGLLLNIGLPNDVPLLTSNDLDYFVYPLVPRLTAAFRRPFVSVWVSKRHARTSSVGVFRARPTRDPGGSQQFQVRTTASVISTTFRDQIRNQVADARPLPPGAIALQLSFLVGPRRAWSNLWKVTIDSLGPMLGHAARTRGGAGPDGRITDLGLHCVVDPDVGHDVVIRLRASPDVESRRQGGTRASDRPSAAVHTT
ncbi:hypothetical protein [Actinoplanes ianthinogenes]|uniref:hypothetical protein n=1 Tax=Actinoplanes ianthinogenes TaxID=122358 RepID=UPI00166FCE6A|nr:hypothetical protein [Actinoplanes ianthinogenes]